MIILSDCFTEKIDEGCLKVANSLAFRIKKADPDTLLISYKRKPVQETIHLNLNPLFLNRALTKVIRKEKEALLYIPFSSNTLGSAIRMLVLSLYAKRKVSVLFALRFHMNFMTRILLKMSGANIIALSADSYHYYSSKIGKATYLKTGIDTDTFVPVSENEKRKIRESYGLKDSEKVVLHVGHLKSSRNIDKLLEISPEYRIFLVVSSETDKEEALLEELLARPNITIIDSYLPHVEEIYQMTDVYLFPVEQAENCIDVPLSVLEAASCNIPIVTSEYGELKVFKEEKGFCFLPDMGDSIALNQALDRMSGMKDCHNREAVLEYDWNCSIEKLIGK